MNQNKQIILSLLNSFLFCLVVFLIAVMMLGCTKTEIVYKDKIVEVYVPTPQKCDYTLSKEPSLDTSSNENLLNSLTELSYDSVKLRKEIKNIPCLNIK